MAQARPRARSTRRMARQADLPVQPEFQKINWCFEYFLVWKNSKSQLPCAKLILSIKMPDSGCKSLVVLQLWVQDGLGDESGEASMGSLVSKPILFRVGQDLLL